MSYPQNENSLADLTPRKRPTNTEKAGSRELLDYALQDLIDDAQGRRGEQYVKVSDSSIYSQM